MRVSGNIRVGDILTSFSIIISAAGLGLGMYADAENQRRAEANEVRAAAAETLAKLERWREVAVYAADELHPATVSASMLLSERGDPEIARDGFWAEVDKAKIASRRLALDENLEGSYTKLFAYDPRVRPLLTKTLEALKRDHELMLRSINDHAQCEILYRARASEPTAKLGNQLRYVLLERAQRYSKLMEADIDPAKDFLTALIESPDDEVLSRRAVSRTLRSAPPVRPSEPPIDCAVAAT